jgi:hypothetical protein
MGGLGRLRLGFVNLKVTQLSMSKSAVAREELIERWYERVPVQGHEACRLDDGSLVHVGGIALQTNTRLDHDEQLFLVSMSTHEALDLVDRAGRAPRDVQFAHIQEAECHRPLLVMQTTDGSRYLIDGACRSIQAQKYGVTQLRAVIVDEGFARQQTIPVIDNLGNQPSLNLARDDKTLERIVKHSLMREGERFSSSAGGRNRTEPALGPVRGYGDTILDDRIYAFPQTLDFGRDVPEGASKAGNAPLSDASVKCRAAMIRVLMSLKAFMASTGNDMSREDFLRVALRVGTNRDETFSKKAAEQAATFVPDARRSEVAAGLQLLPNVKSLLELWGRPEYQRWSDPITLTVKTPTKDSAVPLGVTDLLMHLETESYIILSALGIMDRRASTQSAGAKHLIKSAEQRARLEHDDFRGNALGNASSLALGACPSIALLLKGSNASGVNAATLWADIQRCLSVCEWATILGQLERGERADLHPMAAEAFIAAETLQTVFGKRNSYSESWDSVRSMARDAGLQKTMVRQSLLAAGSGCHYTIKSDA